MEEVSASYPFFGIIFGLILILGLYQIGGLIFKNQIIYNIFKDLSEIKYQKIFLAVNLILLIFYPLILYLKTVYLIHSLGFIILFFGLYNIFCIVKKIKNKIKLSKKYESLDEITVYVVLLGLCLLSLTPNTHADSLGYHFIVANSILNFGKYPLDITHIHTLLSGSGELLISVGLLFGSEQFGSLVQFTGLISILGIFKKINHQKKYFFLLLALTTPIIIFLCSTAKPQLFHTCSSTLVFAMYFVVKQNNLSNLEKIIKILISLIILLVSFSSKFNFLVSSFLLSGYILYNSIIEKNFKYFILISSLVFFIFYFPVVYLKYIEFGGSIFQYLYTPLPINLLGMEEFKTYLVRFARHGDYFSILVPSSLGQFTNSIGIAFIYLLILNYKNKFSKLTFLFVITYLILHYFFGQFIGRSFMEPLFWILVICAAYGINPRFKFFEFFCRFQSYIVIVSIFFGVCILFPASLTKIQKDRVFKNHASGYSLFKWANTKLKEDDVAFSYHRSISLGNSNYISMDFVPYVNLRDKRNFMYVNKILEKKPKYFLTYAFSNNKPYLSIFKKCIGKLLYFEKNVGKLETRNPFNRGNSYSGYIYQFEIENFPKCVVEPGQI